MTVVAGSTGGIGAQVVAMPTHQGHETFIEVDELARPASSVDPEARLAAAAYMLHRSGDSALLVRHDGAEPVGLLSAVDIVRAVAAGLDPDRTRVEQIVAEAPRRVDPAVPGLVAAQMMLSAGVEHLVVAGGHRPVGIVSLVDVCHSLVRTAAVALLPRESQTSHGARRSRRTRSLSLPPERIGPMIRRLRHRADLTLERLSQLSGISDRALSDIEREVARGPQHRTVLAIARALQLSGPDRAGLLEAARAGRSRSTTPGARRAARPGMPVLTR